MLITKYHLNITAPKQIQNYQTKFGDLEATVNYKPDNVNRHGHEFCARMLGGRKMITLSLNCNSKFHFVSLMISAVLV